MKAYGFRVTQRKSDRPHINLQEQIKAPEKLKLLVLSGSHLGPGDFVFILKCRNIMKLDLSDNELTKVPPEFDGSQLPNLQLLFLHNNYFKDIEGIRPIVLCGCLIQVTIYNNPLQSPQTEHYLINVLPKLKMVNDRIVFE